MWALSGGADVLRHRERGDHLHLLYARRLLRGADGDDGFGDAHLHHSAQQLVCPQLHALRQLLFIGAARVTVDDLFAAGACRGRPQLLSHDCANEPIYHSANDGLSYHHPDSPNSSEQPIQRQFAQLDPFQPLGCEASCVHCVRLLSDRGSNRSILQLSQPKRVSFEIDQHSIFGSYNTPQRLHLGLSSGNTVCAEITMFD